MLTPQFDLYQHIAGHLAGQRVLEVLVDGARQREYTYELLPATSTSG